MMTVRPLSSVFTVVRRSNDARSCAPAVAATSVRSISASHSLRTAVMHSSLLVLEPAYFTSNGTSSFRFVSNLFHAIAELPQLGGNQCSVIALDLDLGSSGSAAGAAPFLQLRGQCRQRLLGQLETAGHRHRLSGAAFSIERDTDRLHGWLSVLRRRGRFAKTLRRFGVGGPDQPGVGGWHSTGHCIRERGGAVDFSLSAFRHSTLDIRRLNLDPRRPPPAVAYSNVDCRMSRSNHPPTLPGGKPMLSRTAE